MQYCLPVNMETWNLNADSNFSWRYYADDAMSEANYIKFSGREMDKQFFQFHAWFVWLIAFIYYKNFPCLHFTFLDQRCLKLGLIYIAI